MSDTPRAWLVTGCSTGLGRALVQALISRDERVFATARNPQQLSDLVGGHGNATALKLDVTSAEDIKVAAAAVEKAGGVDVLVNNAGYGYLTAFEEGDEAGYRAQFETNMFGLIAMTKAILPAMRARGSGHIVNIASVGGFVGNPGSAYYAATKFGVVGLSEALSKEVGALGVKVTVVEPGPFRTDWAARSLQSSGKQIDAYAKTVHERLDQLARFSGNQPGDPARAANAIIAAVDSEHPPLNLMLGAPGLKMARDKLTTLAAELDRWEAVTLSATTRGDLNRLPASDSVGSRETPRGQLLSRRDCANWAITAKASTRSARRSPVQLRQRRADRGRRPCPSPGRAEARRSPAPRH